MKQSCINVIHVTWDAGTGGVRTLLLNLIAYQKKAYKNLRVAVAFEADGRGAGRYKKLGVPIYIFRRKTAKDIKLLFQFYKIFKNYDIVNLHVYSPWAFLAGKIARKKVVITFHGALGLKKKWMDVLVKLFYRLVMNRYCDRITFASKCSLSRYLNGIDCKLKDEKMELFPYGLQIDKVIPNKSRKKVREYLQVNGKFVVGTAASLYPIKRIDRLIEAFANLPKCDDFRLIIMGTGDESYQNYLVNKVIDYSLQDYIRFLGHREDALDIVNALDLFVLPSNNEAFGLALLEAMALGIPSAVFEDGGGPVDILGDSGIIVKNPLQLRDFILKLKSDNLLRELIAKRVKERARQFDIKYTAEHLNRIYGSLLEGAV